MMVMGEGSTPSLENLRALAKKHGIRKGDAIIDAVRSAVVGWAGSADAAGVSKKSAQMIAARIAAPLAKSAKKSPARKSPTARKPTPPKKQGAAKKTTRKR